MTKQLYEELKRTRIRNAWSPRPRCARCCRPPSGCYCPVIRSFQSSPEFVILIHRNEVRRGIATGRMSHLCLNNSLLIEGVTFGEHLKVNAILNDPSVFPVLLYPSPNALNLSRLSSDERGGQFPKGRRLVIFVIDATWGQAKRVRRLSPNLMSLPTICFTPPTVSNFRVRKQPKPICYSTIEAIHQVIDLLSEKNQTGHHNLLAVFNSMVEKQLTFRRADSSPDGHIGTEMTAEPRYSPVIENVAN